MSYLILQKLPVSSCLGLFVYFFFSYDQEENKSIVKKNLDLIYWAMKQILKNL